MADTPYLHREVRFVINDDATLCYVKLEMGDDSPLADGWHFKSFPPSKTTIEILRDEIADAIMWPRKDPEIPRVTKRFPGAIPKETLPLFLSRRVTDGWVVVLTKMDPDAVEFAVYEWKADVTGVLFGRFTDPDSFQRELPKASPIQRGRVQADGRMELRYASGEHACDPMDLETYAALPKEAYRYAMGHIPNARLDDQFTPKPAPR